MASFHRSPSNALWLGGRVGVLFPFGNAYAVPANNYFAVGEPWSGLATGGLSLEGDVGVRFSRHYIVYGFWEHGRLSQGSDSSWRTGTENVPAFGAQDSATTDFTGLGFRWSSRPDRVGVVVDLGLGYRWFRERWSTGTKMDLQGFGEFRVGVGADVRINRAFSISPMLSVSSGSFTDREITFPGQASAPIQSLSASHGTFTLTLGGHFDLGG
jgi:hypothetical protein